MRADSDCRRYAEVSPMERSQPVQAVGVRTPVQCVAHDLLCATVRRGCTHPHDDDSSSREDGVNDETRVVEVRMR